MDKLGIEPITIGFQLINFFVLLIVLKKFLYKPVVGMLEKRSQQIAEAERVSKEIEQQKAAVEADRAQMTADFQKEAAGMMDDVKKQGEAIKQQLEQEARTKADHLLKKAQEDIQLREDTLKQEAQQQAHEAAVEMTEKILATSLTDEERARILNTAVEDFRL